MSDFDASVVGLIVGNEMIDSQINVAKSKNQKQSEVATTAASHLARQMAIINEVGSEIVTFLDAEVVLQKVVYKLQQGMDYHRVTVMLVEGTGLSIKAQSPPLSGLSEFRLLYLAWQDHAAQRVVATAEPFSFSADESHLSGVAVPLHVQDRVLGGLVVEFGKSGETETTELSFLMTVASLVAVAVENIRLFQMALEQSRYLEQRADHLSQMLSASNHLLRLGPYSESLLLAVARLAHESLGFRLVAASQFDPDGGRLLTHLLVAMTPGTSPKVRSMSSDWTRLAPLLRSEFQTSHSYHLLGSQVNQICKDDQSFHLPEVVPGEEAWRPQDALLVPFRGREGRITGVLTLDYPKEGLLLSQETVHAAELFANQAAIALDNARLFEELQRRLRETNTLFAMGQEMVTTLDQDQVLVAITRAALTLVASSNKAAIHLLDETNHLIPLVVHPPEARVSPPVGMKIGEGIAGLAAAQNRALYVPDVSQDRRLVGRAANFLSLLVVPINVGGRVIGTLSVDSSQIDAFRPDDERVLIILANQAAIALENARLYAEAKRVDELAILNHLTSRLSSSLDRMHLLHTAVEEIARTLKAEASAIILLPESEKRSAPYIVFCCCNENTAQEGEFRLLASRELSPLVSEGNLLAELAAQGITVRQSLQTILTAHDRAIGYVEVYNLLDEESSDEASTLLNSMAVAVAMALENARLYEEVRDSAEELAASQAQLIQSAKLAATGKLAASIAHEINNPLQAVQSCVYLLSDSVPTDDPNRPYLDIAQEELGRIARIVERMVDFYRPAKEGREPTDVNLLLESVLALARKRMQQTGVKLHANLNSYLPEITATADHIKQVFLNVVLNALEAMPDGGKLTVTTRLATASKGSSSLRPEAQQVEIQFTDNGIGIEAKDMPRIFDPFFTSKPKGTGLGLSISYDIVERHGGTIEVESMPDQGTIFTVRLPVRSDIEKHWR